jgi:hypothetical protein
MEKTTPPKLNDKLTPREARILGQKPKPDDKQSAPPAKR